MYKGKLCGTKILELVDGQANAWPFSVFTQKQVFGLRTAKSQLIWIKLCTHLSLYGIHLCADLDRDLCVGAPGQTRTTMFFSVILVTHRSPI